MLVEVADSSQEKDLRRKRELYAKAGVAEYWVADLTRREMIVHRKPQADGSYAEVTTHRRGETVTAEALPDAALDLGWLF